MDIEDRLLLISRDPTEEVVTEPELRTLLESVARPKHYIGLEISGMLHLGSLILTGFKINDFIKAQVQCTVFLADWHTYINDSSAATGQKSRRYQNTILRRSDIFVQAYQ